MPRRSPPRESARSGPRHRPSRAARGSCGAMRSFAAADNAVFHRHQLCVTRRWRRRERACSLVEALGAIGGIRGCARRSGAGWRQAGTSFALLRGRASLLQSSWGMHLTFCKQPKNVRFSSSLQSTSSARQNPPQAARMKYSQLRRGLSPEDAAAYVGSKELLRQFERAKWVKPFIRGNRLTRFDIRDLDTCIDRLKGGELLSANQPRTATP